MQVKAKKTIVALDCNCELQAFSVQMIVQNQYFAPNMRATKLATQYSHSGLQYEFTAISCLEY